MIKIPIHHKQIQKIGSYELHRNNILGKGSFSTVYMGIYTKDPTQKVAIKKLAISNMTSKALKFANSEIDIMKKIKNNPHPNIIKCYDIINDDVDVYIIMEYCDGGELSTILTKPLTESTSKYYFKQLVDAMIHLDSHNIIHRDIKPKNILLTDNKLTLKICDFGFSKEKTGLKKISSICGSPMYMAPEILLNRTYNESVDIWSLGLILYEFVFGSHPYKHCKSLVDIRDEVISQSIPIPPNNNTSYKLSQECILLLKSLLNSNPESRLTLSDIKTNKWFADYNHQIYQKFADTDINDTSDDIDFGILKDVSESPTTNDIMNSVDSFDNFL